MLWAELILKLAPVLIELGTKAAPLAGELVASIRGGGEGPTPEQLAKLQKLEDEARGILHAPFTD